MALIGVDGVPHCWGALVSMKCEGAAEGSVAYDHGVETGAGEAVAGRADEVLGCLELGFKVGLRFGGVISEEGAVVEALVCGAGRGANGGQGREPQTDSHGERMLGIGEGLLSSTS